MFMAYPKNDDYKKLAFTSLAQLGSLPHCHEAPFYCRVWPEAFRKALRASWVNPDRRLGWGEPSDARTKWRCFMGKSSINGVYRFTITKNPSKSSVDGGFLRGNPWTKRRFAIIYLSVIFWWPHLTSSKDHGDVFLVKLSRNGLRSSLGLGIF